jgi:hypothetical protein
MGRGKKELVSCFPTQWFAAGGGICFSGLPHWFFPLIFGVFFCIFLNGLPRKTAKPFFPAI